MLAIQRSVTQWMEVQRSPDRARARLDLLGNTSRRIDRARCTRGSCTFQTDRSLCGMDLVGYSKEAFDRIVAEYGTFLREIDIEPTNFVPVAGRDGDNVARGSAAMPWYTGPTVLQTLDRFESERSPVEKPFRLPVQDVYKFTQQGDDRRIVAGTVDVGTVRVGDAVVFYPSGKKGRVASIETFSAPAAS